MIINGQKMKFESGITIEELLKRLNVSKDKVVVEVNFEIVCKEKYEGRVLNKQDKIEIVAFVGGG